MYQKKSAPGSDNDRPRRAVLVGGALPEYSLPLEYGNEIPFPWRFRTPRRYGAGSTPKTSAGPESWTTCNVSMCYQRVGSTGQALAVGCRATRKFCGSLLGRKPCFTTVYVPRTDGAPLMTPAFRGAGSTNGQEEPPTGLLARERLSATLHQYVGRDANDSQDFG